MSKVEEEMNKRLSAQTGFSLAQVEFLRGEFRKFGRNPHESYLEILAIENSMDEERVKVLTKRKLVSPISAQVH